MMTSKDLDHDVGVSYCISLLLLFGTLLARHFCCVEASHQAACTSIAAPPNNTSTDFSVVCGTSAHIMLE